MYKIDRPEYGGFFLVNKFWPTCPPSPINFVHDHFLFSIHFKIIGPLASASRSARPAPPCPIAAVLGPEWPLGGLT